MSARREEPAGAVKGLRRGWAEGLQGPRAVLPPGERPLKSRGGKRADKKGPQEPGRGADVWILLAEGCREACWSCARLQRAPLSPSLSRALKIHPETKTSMCVRV